MIFCIDTNIFINGIKKNTNELDKIERAEYFFKWAQDGGHRILIPTIVLAEILAPEPLEKYPVWLDIIEKNGFIIVPFDSRAATKYSQLMMNKIEDLKKIADEIGILRSKMKLDHQIIACALIHNAERIYSTDKGVKTFGQKFIEVSELPTPPLKQPNLFGE